VAKKDGILVAILMRQWQMLAIFYKKCVVVANLMALAKKRQ
jgi:hypothetical protein